YPGSTREAYSCATVSNIGSIRARSAFSSSSPADSLVSTLVLPVTRHSPYSPGAARAPACSVAGRLDLVNYGRSRGALSIHGPTRHPARRQPGHPETRADGRTHQQRREDRPHAEVAPEHDADQDGG